MVISDEVTDCSNKEQLGLVLRYVEGNSIREDLVSCLECDTGTSGQAIADKLLGFLNQERLDLNNIRGQAYDGVVS